MSFGRMPIANEYFFELQVAFCSDCGMVQLAEQVEPGKMFHENYAFFRPLRPGWLPTLSNGRISSCFVLCGRDYGQGTKFSSRRRQKADICAKGRGAGMIQCANPRLQYLARKEEINDAVMRTLDRGRYILGEAVKAFEDEFSAYGTWVGS